MIHSTPKQPSHSRLFTLHSCRRKYFYSYHLGLQTKGEFPPAHAGSAGHAALEAWHRTGDAEAAQAALVAAWAGKKFYGDWDFLSLGHMQAVVEAYMASKHTQDWEVVRLRMEDLDSSRLIATDAVADSLGYLMLAEASFIVNVPGLGIVNVRPDLLTKVASGYRIVDHKFKSGYLGSKLYNEAKFGHQLRLYAMAMEALLGQPLREAAVNAIYIGSTASSPAFKGKRFDAYNFDYSAADFEETIAWVRAGRIAMADFEEHFTDADELGAPQSPGSNCGYCDYALLCSTAPAYRPPLIKLNYARRQV